MFGHVTEKSDRGSNLLYLTQSTNTTQPKKVCYRFTKVRDITEGCNTYLTYVPTYQPTNQSFLPNVKTQEKESKLRPAWRKGYISQLIAYLTNGAAFSCLKKTSLWRKTYLELHDFGYNVGIKKSK